MKTAFYTITLLLFAALVGGWAADNVQAQASWYDSSWDYRQKITIASSQVQSSLTNFPVYVDLATMSSGFFSNVQSDGGDIRVTQSDGTTEVAREITALDIASSTGELHFKAPSVSSSTDTEFYIYYGNNGASNYADSNTYGMHNVWTNGFTGVWLLHEGSGDTIYDRTSNERDGVVDDGSINWISTPFGTAIDVSNASIAIDGQQGLSGDQPFTTSLWIKSDGSGGNAVMSVNYAEAHRGVDFWQSGSGIQQHIIHEWSNDALKAGGDSGSANFIDKFDNNWHRVVSTYDGSKSPSGMNMYTDGLHQGQDVQNNSLSSNDVSRNVPTRLNGRNDDESTPEASNILSDLQVFDFRVAIKERSQPWISAEYSNQNSPTTFYTVGSEETESNSGKMSSDNYTIVRDSLNSGGLDQANSANYQVRDTVGQPATGPATSTNYTVRAGYRQMAASSIAVSAPASVTLPALGGVVGGTSETTADVNVITDSPGGYELKVRATTSPALTSNEDSFADYAAGSSADFDFQIASSESSFGYTPEGADVADAFLDDGTNCGTGSQDSQSACWRGFATTDRVIAESTDNNQPNGEITTLRLQAESGGDNIQTSGQYDATIVVTGVAL